MLTVTRLREILEYDAETGIFRWRVALSNAAPVGTIAGSIDGSGYIQIRINKKYYKAHRLAWLYVYGHWPKKLTDHKNGKTTDNRLRNLREADTYQNTYNRKLGKANNSGTTGVYFCEQSGNWRAKIAVGGKHLYLGSYNKLEQAVEKRKFAETIFFDEFVRKAG